MKIFMLHVQELKILYLSYSGDISPFIKEMMLIIIGYDLNIKEKKKISNIFDIKIN